MTAATEGECYRRLLAYARGQPFGGTWEMDVRRAGEYPVGKREDIP